MAVRTVIATTTADMRWPSADTSDNFDYTLDLTGTVDPADSLVSVTWEVSPPDITPIIPGVSGLLVTAWLAGGVPGRDYTVRVTVVTVSRTIRRDVSLFIELGTAAFPPATFSKAFGTPLVWVSGVSPSPPVPTSAIHLTATGAALAVDHDATIGGALTVGGTIAGAGVTALLAPFALSSALTSGLAGKLALTGGALTGGLTGTTGLFSAAVSGAGVSSTGTTSITAGSGTNKIILGPSAVGTITTLTATGADGLLISAQNGAPIKFTSPVTVVAQPVTINSASIILNNGGAGQIVSGSSYTAAFDSAYNISGTYTGTNHVNVHNIHCAADTLDATNGGANPGGFLAGMQIAHNYGTGAKGNRQALGVSLQANTSPITGDTSSQQYQVASFVNGAAVNVGGTSAGTPAGSMYGAEFACMLNGTATNWTLLNGLGEVDTGVFGPAQTLTITGTPGAGDVASLTFTSTAIAGSPLTVSHTVQAGETVNGVANALHSLILQTPALAAASVTATSAFGHNRQPISLSWLTGLTVSVSGSATGGTVLTLGAPPGATGASVRQKFGATFVRLAADNQAGMGDSTAPSRTGSQFCDSTIRVTSQGCNPLTGWDEILTVMADAISPAGSLIRVQPLSGLSSGGRNGLIPSPTLTYGLHLQDVNFADQNGFPLFTPGFSVSGTGTVSVGNGTLSYSAAGVGLDVTGYVGTGDATIGAAGGGGAGSDLNNYFIGDLVQDSLGGQHIVTAVNSGTGAATAVRTIVQPFSRGTLPATNQVTIRGSGTGLSLHIAWTAANTIKLNPSGGPVSVGGASSAVGFYGHAPAAQAATPVTLADVIAVIRGVGLAA